MLIGGHVSPAGGLPNAILRGEEIGAESIQIFHQSPRAWRPTAHPEEAIAEFREKLGQSPIDSVVIHAVYLINCASKDAEIKRKSRTSLVHALRLGDAIGADGVVLHPGSTVGEPHEAAMKRAAKIFAEALAESESCRLLLEDTAGAGNTLGRSFDELASLIDLTGGDPRVGLCLDCCHMLASGFDITTAAKLAAVMDDCDRVIGNERLRALHVNDSQTPLGSNRDRHASLQEGELGERGLSAFLSEPRFEGLPAILETKADREQIEIARRLRKKGLAARRRTKRKP